MFLLIDLSVRDKIILVLFNAANNFSKEFSKLNRELLLCIDEFLLEIKVNKKDIQGILVVLGEGSFTSTRIAVTVANTFAYVLNIPVLGIKKQDAGDLNSLIPVLLKQKKSQYIFANYSGEPNISKTKKH